jgi:hypothetical protein
MCYYHEVITELREKGCISRKQEQLLDYIEKEVERRIEPFGCE